MTVQKLAVFPGDSESAPGIMPFNIAVGTTYTARPAFNTSLIAHGYSFFFFIPIIHVSRANARTGSILIVQADLRINDFYMTYLVRIETKQKQFVI
jgi:hypothetical protein